MYITGNQKVEKKTAHLRLVDPDTGNTFAEGGQFVYFTSRRIQVKESFMLAFAHGYQQLAEMKLSGETTRVLFALWARMVFENWVLIPQNEIAESLGMKQQNVARAIKELKKAGILIPGPKHGKSVSYRMNDIYAWKGSAQKLAEHRLRLVKNDKPKPKETT